MNRFLLCAGLMVSAFFSSPVRAAGEVPEGLAEQLLAVSGTDKQIEGLSKAVEQAFSGDVEASPLSAAARTEATKVGRRALDPKRFRQDLLKELAARLSLADLNALIAWYDSPLGKKVVKLEAAEPAWQDEGPGKDATPKAEPTERVQRCERILDASKAVDAMVNVLLSVKEGVARAAAPSAEEGQQHAVRVRDACKKGENQIRQAYQHAMLAGLCEFYRPLSDEELEQYATFSELPAAVRFSETLLRIMGRLTAEASEAIALAVKPHIKKPENQRPLLPSTLHI